MDLVTICIVTHNRDKKIINSINSVRRQSYSNIEIIVIDNNSNDNTQKVIMKLKNNDSRIKYYQLEKNYGLAYARNIGINSATGNYFTFIDDDDEWDKDIIKKFMIETKVNNNENIIYVCGNRLNTYDLIPRYSGQLIDIVKKGYTPPVGGQFYPMHLILKVNGYNTNVRSGVDHDLWIRLCSMNPKIKSIPEALAIPNIENDYQRMTKNIDQRVKGIIKSLEIWKDEYIDLLDEKQFNIFSDAYLSYLIVQCIKNKKYNKAKKIYKKLLNKKYIIIKIISLVIILINIHINKYINRRNITVRPSLPTSIF